MMKRPHAARWLALLLVLAASGVGVRALAGPWLPPDGRPAGFSDHVTAACAVALIGCWAWLALGSVLVAVQTSTQAPALSGRRLTWVPGVLRVLVPAVLGVAVTTAPAGAAPVPAPVPGPGPSSTSSSAAWAAATGLPLPDRAATTHERPRTVVVRSGDTLWAIAAALLPGSPANAAVDAAWRRLARANVDRVPDPHLILPGTHLRVPSDADLRSPVHPREEAP